MLHDLWLVLTGRLSSAKLQAVITERDRYDENAVRVRDQRDSLTTTLLAIDEELSRIQQCSSWAQMQPIFTRLWTGAEWRRRHVSNQIGTQQIARISDSFVAKDYEISKEETDRMLREAALDHKVDDR